MTTIANLFCVGRNYVAHAQELNNAVPQAPMFFMKPTHAAHLISENNLIPLPKNQGAVHYEAELVIRLKRSYTADLPLEEIIASVSLGIDFTLRDLQQTAKEKGLPWLAAKGFKHSALLTQEIPFVSEEWFNELRFSLTQNDATVQQGNPELMIFPLKQILLAAENTFGTGPNDLIFTGTPEGVGAVKSGDNFQLTLQDYFSEEFTIA